MFFLEVVITCNGQHLYKGKRANFHSATNPICPMGLEYLPPFSLNIMVNVGKYYGKCQCKYASPMEYMEITKKTSGFSKFGSKV